MAKNWASVRELRKDTPQDEEEHSRLSDESNILEAYERRISDTISGTIQGFDVLVTSSSEEQLFKLMTLAYAQKHNLLRDAGKWGTDRPIPDKSYQWPDELRGAEREDPVVCLLQWCYGQYAVTSQSEVEYQRCQTFALRRAHNLDEDPYLTKIREEKWISLALLQVELFGNLKKTQSFIAQLLQEVEKRLGERESKKLGKSPTWGYRCLDHSLSIDLAIAKYKSRMMKSEKLRKIVQDAYFDCECFQRSDYSFLKSWDTSEPNWTTEYWDLDCSSRVSSTLLSICTLDWRRVIDEENGSQPVTTDTETTHQTPRPGTLEVQLFEFLRGLQNNKSQPERKQVKFPWKQNLRAGIQFYPHFMQVDPAGRELSHDKSSLKDRVKDLQSQLSEWAHGVILGIPNDRWSPDALSPKGCTVRIFDFPRATSTPAPAPERVREILENSVRFSISYTSRLFFLSS